MSEVVIYKAKDGHIELSVTLSEETVWLSLSQMTELFGRDKSVISRHLANIFKSKELHKDSNSHFERAILTSSRAQRRISQLWHRV